MLREALFAPLDFHVARLRKQQHQRRARQRQIHTITGPDHRR
jgi:hypothetical protein